MAAWTDEQRAELRAAFEQSQREALAESRRLASLKPAAPAPSPAQILQAVITAPPPAAKPTPRPSRSSPHDLSHCVFCGGPTRNYSDVCCAHSDLLEATG